MSSKRTGRRAARGPAVPNRITSANLAEVMAGQTGEPLDAEIVGYIAGIWTGSAKEFGDELAEHPEIDVKQALRTLG